MINNAETVSLIGQPLYNYFFRANSLSRTSFSEKRLVLIKRMKKLRKFIEDKKLDISEETEKYITNKYFGMAVSIHLSNSATRKISLLHTVI